MSDKKDRISNQSYIKKEGKGKTMICIASKYIFTYRGNVAYVDGLWVVNV